ncbi:hypothetical protein J3F84DRAFT_353539 [Trichoderma pleuroticola]
MSTTLPLNVLIEAIDDIIRRCLYSLDTLHEDDEDANTTEAKKQRANLLQWTRRADPAWNESQALGAQLKKTPEYAKPIYDLLVALEENIKLIKKIIRDPTYYLLVSILWDSFENTLGALRNLSIALRVSITYK